MPRTYKHLTLDDYTITKDGIVINKHTNRIVKPQKNGTGYYRVSIGGKLQFVHRLVAQLYIPNPENKPQVNHKDGNRNNNSVENLEWVTSAENSHHALCNGMMKTEARHPKAKLTVDQVKFIKAHMDISSSDFAKAFGVKRETINAIKWGRTWKTV